MHLSNQFYLTYFVFYYLHTDYFTLYFIYADYKNILLITINDHHEFRIYYNEFDCNNLMYDYKNNSVV